MTTMSRAFTIVAIAGHCEVTTFNDDGPQFVEVTVTARNSLDEEVQLRMPVSSRPCVGDSIEVDSTLRMG